MTDTIQKLREAIKRLLKAHRITVQAPPKTITDAENQIAEIQNAVKFAEEALALPTAEQVGDINVAESFTSVTKTAAPVGEREAFERTMMDKFGWERKDFKTDKFGYFDGHTDVAWMAWQARAALSAGDAVDAQRYRWLRDYHIGDSPESIGLKTSKNLGLDAAIDAAMRKGQL